MKVFRKIAVDEAAAHERLAQGRLDAQMIIQAMAEKGVKIELFGSMKSGKVHQFSDIDLVVTDCGPLEPALALYEIELLAGDIPVDVTILEFVPARSLNHVLSR